VASWNLAAERVTGYAGQDIIGCHVSRLYAQEALEQGEPEGHLQQAAVEHRVEHAGWWMRADGHRYRAEVTICALLNGNPEPHGYSYVIRDVTRRSLRDEELRRLRMTVECTQDAIISVTPARGIVTSWNRGAERLFGYSEREMVGRPVDAVVGDGAFGTAPILMRVSGQQRAEHHDMRGLRKNGSAIDTALTVAPVSAGGEVTLIARDVTERKRSEQYLERTFGTYLDREIAEHILREGPALRARKVDVTTMFVDIRDFTAFAEQFDPGEVVETLNCLFELVVPIIAERHGHVDKFVGDGLLAVFGVPANQPDHADLALDAAAAIARAAEEKFQGDLEIGIGIDSGTVIAGNVGGGGRLDFTVIGDAVNTAARIETATRETGDVVLFSEQTLRRLRRDGRAIVPRASVPMKGKRNHVAMYALDTSVRPDEKTEAPS
jgi:PAS domain S-box-containing protein